MNKIKDKPKHACNVSLSVPPSLLKIIDDFLMKKKAVTRSELIRTALREYILRELAFDSMFDYDDAEELLIEELISVKSGTISINGKQYKVIGEA